MSRANFVSRATDAMHRRVGRRGSALLGMAVADALYAVSLLDPTGTASGRWFSQIAPLPLWCGLWMLVAFTCMAGFLAGLCGKAGSRWWAFAPAVGIKVWWTLLSVAGWAAGDLSSGPMGVWFIITYFAALIAGWSEPDSSGQNEP